ncbi:MAG: FliG C-terminal domain-containing protein [Gemmatimonadota bacterium]
MFEPISITSFEGIADLDDDQIKEIIARVGRDDLTICLKAASERVKDRVLGCMSEEERRALTAYMEFLGPMRLSEVAYLQGQVVQKFSGGAPSDDPFV